MAILCLQAAAQTHDPVVVAGAFCALLLAAGVLALNVRRLRRYGQMLRRSALPNGNGRGNSLTQAVTLHDDVLAFGRRHDGSCPADHPAGALRVRADQQLMIGGGASQSNLVILREQLAQLELQRSAGGWTLSSTSRRAATIERRALNRGVGGVERPMRTGQARSTAVLGVGSARAGAHRSTYGLAIPEAILAPAAGAGDGGTRRAEAQIEAWWRSSAQRLRSQPAGEQPDPKAWEMLARSYAALQRFAESDRAYARAHELGAQNAQLLADRGGCVGHAARPAC